MFATGLTLGCWIFANVFFFATVLHACEAPQTPAISVISINPAGEIKLEDGRVVRLAGLLWPASTDKAGRRRLTGALEPWLDGGRLSILPVGKPDRWGRLAAQVFVDDPGHASVWLQGMLAENGFAMIWPEPEARGCWEALRRVENEASGKGLGLWSPLRRRARRLILHNEGAMPLNPRVVYVAKVRSVREGRSVIFVNFHGTRAKTPYLSIQKRSVDEFRRQGLDPATFSGKRLKVRGILAYGSTTRLTISGPQAIEVLE